MRVQRDQTAAAKAPDQVHILHQHQWFHAPRIREHIAVDQQCLIAIGQRQRPAPVVAGAAPKLTPQVPRQAPVAPPPPVLVKRKLGFKEQRELEQLPALIETLETQVAAESARVSSAELYREGSAAVQAANRQLSELQSRLESAYARWSELD